MSGCPFMPSAIGHDGSTQKAHSLSEPHNKIKQVTPNNSVDQPNVSSNSISESSATSAIPILSSIPPIQFLPDAVLIVDEASIIIDCNATACDLFGFSRSGLVGLSVQQLVPLQHRIDHQRYVQEVFASMIPREMSKRHNVSACPMSGKSFEVSVHLAPALLRDTVQVSEVDRQNGVLVERTSLRKIVMCVCRDMRVHNAMLRQKLETEQRMLQTEALLRLMNHEVRTSMHSVVNALLAVKEDMVSFIRNSGSIIDPAWLREDPTTPQPLTNENEPHKQQRSASPHIERSSARISVPAAVTPMPLTVTAIAPPTLCAAQILKQNENVNLKLPSPQPPLTRSVSSSPPAAVRSLLMLEAGVTGMDMLMRNLLDYRGLTAGTLVNTPMALDVKYFLEGLKFNQRARWLTKQQRVSVSVPNPLPLIYCDTTLLTKLVECLFDNCIKHAGPGAEIMLECTEVDERATISKSETLSATPVDPDGAAPSVVTGVGFGNDESTDESEKGLQHNRTYIGTHVHSCHPLQVPPPHVKHIELLLSSPPPPRPRLSAPLPSESPPIEFEPSNQWPESQPASADADIVGSRSHYKHVVIQQGSPHVSPSRKRERTIEYPSDSASSVDGNSPPVTSSDSSIPVKHQDTSVSIRSDSASKTESASEHSSSRVPVSFVSFLLSKRHPPSSRLRTGAEATAVTSSPVISSSPTATTSVFSEAPAVNELHPTSLEGDQSTNQNAEKLADSSRSPAQRIQQKVSVVQLQFVVCDTGIGLSPDLFHAIENEILHNSDASSTRPTTGGVGLGLHIAKMCAANLQATLMLSTTARQHQQRQRVEPIHNEQPEQPSLSRNDHRTWEPFLDSSNIPTIARMPSSSSTSPSRTWTTAFSFVATFETIPSASAASPAEPQQLQQPSTSTRCTSQLNNTESPNASDSRSQLAAFRTLSDLQQQQSIVQQLCSPRWDVARSQFRILIVEDHPINVKVMQRLLEKHGFTNVQHCGNGKIAVERCAFYMHQQQQETNQQGFKEDQPEKRPEADSANPDVPHGSDPLDPNSNTSSSIQPPPCQYPFDLILMDCEMPVQDGWSTTVQLRQQLRCLSPIFALTANATLQAQERCYECGMDLFLTKPLAAHPLLFAIASLPPFNLFPLEYCPHVLLPATFSSPTIVE